MKKRVLFHTHMLEVDALKNYLDDQLKEGWILIKVGREFLTFEKYENPDFQYALGIFQCDTNENNEYKDLAEQFGFEYVGDREGIVIFKTTSDVPFYSDELVDEEYRDSKIRKSMFHRFIQALFLIWILFYHFIYSPSELDFVSDFIIYSALVFTLLIVARLFSVDLGIIPYLKYKKTHQVKKVYKGIECRSWFYLISSIIFLTPVFMFLVTDLKYENVSYMNYFLMSWIGAMIIAVFFYHFRTHWFRAFEICTISVMLFITLFILIAINQNQPATEPIDINWGQLIGYQKIKYYVDSYEIPLSLCSSETCELVQNDIQKSILLKKQNIMQTSEKEKYSYIYNYYEVKPTCFEEKVIQHIFDHWEWFVKCDQTFKEYSYGYEPFKNEKIVDLIVRKNNEIYVFIGLDCETTEEAVKSFIETIPWKS